MSSRLFQLVPQQTEARIRGNRISRAISSVAAVVFGLAAMVTGGSHWLSVRAQTQLMFAQQEGAPVIKIDEEIKELEARERKITESVALQRSLANMIPANGVIRAVSDALPKGALIRSITLEYQNVQGSSRRPQQPAPNGGAPALPPRALSCVIEGIAADDRDVGEIIDGLSALKSLSRVTLESSRSYEFRGKNAREFKVTFSADLEKRWKLPRITTATERGEATP